MRVKKVKLKNYYSHSELDVDFTGNCIGIVGRNGAGKSALVSAIKAAVTGEFDKPKDQCLKAGETSGHIEVTTEVGPGLDVTVFRDLKKSTATLSFSDGREPISGSDAVSSTMLGLIDGDKTLLSQVVFVKQGQIESLLFSRDSVKSRMAQKFFGLDKANAIEKELGEVNLDFYLVDRPSSEYLNDLNKARGDERAKVRERDELRSKFDERRLKSLQADLAEFLRNQREIQRRNNLIEQRDRIAAEIKKLGAEQAELKAGVDVIPADRLKKKYQAELEKRRIYESRQELTKSLNAKMAELVALGDAPCTQEFLDQIQQEIDEKTRDAAEDSVHPEARKTIANLIESSGHANCPTCHTTLSSDDLGRIEQAIKHDQEARQAEEILPVLIQRRNNWRSSLGQWQRSRGTLESVIADLENKISNLGPDRGPGDPEKWEQNLSTYNKMVSDLSAVTGRIAEHQRELDTLCEVGGELQSAVQIDPVAAQEEINVLVQAQSDIQKLDGEIAVLATDVRHLEGEVERRRRMEAENAIKHRVKTSIDRIRKAFHPDSAPKELIGRRVSVMQERINQYLSLLDTPFRVRASGGFNFEASFDGSNAAIQASDLSGGQKIDLSLAFRFAACETLCSSIGLLVLDEPTVYLDEETVEHFSRVIERLKVMANELGMQFIVVTHERSLIPCFDQLIEL